MEELQKEWFVPVNILPPGSKINMWFDVEKCSTATKEVLEKVRKGREK
ncbi:hypothetical protein ACDX78_09105 [Virgibacillus oceani]